jgi:hypothetical protein
MTNQKPTLGQHVVFAKPALSEVLDAWRSAG